MFKKTLYTVPGEIKSGQKGVHVEWLYDGITPKDIDDVKPGCSCTAKIHVKEDRIVAKYDDQKSSPGLVTKSVTVYFNDGKPLKIRNDKGVMIHNPKKKSLSLTFHVNVVK